MELKSGDIVSVAHYSEGNPFQSVVLDVLDNEVLLSLPKKFAIFNLFEDDPVVLGFQTGVNIYAAECSIRTINPKNNSIGLKVENIEYIKEKRIFERFPVSLCTDIITSEEDKKKVAFIRNISLEGFAIVTKSELSQGDTVNFDVYIDNRVLKLSGEVVWKERGNNSFQYGLKSIYTDFNTKNSLKLYLKILKDEQENAVIKIRD